MISSEEEFYSFLKQNLPQMAVVIYLFWESEVYDLL